jgi:chromosome partition protein MukE
MSEPFSNLGDVVLDASFPEVDLALRRGHHVHKGEERWYAFLSDAQALLEPLYQRYGYELVHRSDGYFFLLPVSDGLGKRALSVPEMIVGQGLALAYLDPRALEKGGVISREELINQLAAALGSDALLQVLSPKRKRQDDRVRERNARLKVADAARRLAQLGFVELLEGEQLRLCPSLMRFAEPVRGLAAPAEALRQLLARGEVSLGPGDTEAEDSERDNLDAEPAGDTPLSGDAAELEAAADVDGISTEDERFLAASDALAKQRESAGPEVSDEAEPVGAGAEQAAPSADEQSPSVPPPNFYDDDFWSDEPASETGSA